MAGTDCHACVSRPSGETTRGPNRVLDKPIHSSCMADPIVRATQKLLSARAKAREADKEREKAYDVWSKAEDRANAAGLAAHDALEGLIRAVSRAEAADG